MKEKFSPIVDPLDIMDHQASVVDSAVGFVSDLANEAQYVDFY